MDRRLAAFAALAAAAYWLLELAAVSGSTLLLVKPLAVLALCVGAALAGSRLVAAALLAHAIGDVTIELGGILAGIGPFLVGHLLYLAALWPRLPGKGGSTSLGRRLVVALLAGWSGFLVSLLLPRLTGPLRAAVPVYAAVLLAMASAAALSRTPARVLIGALLYVTSDSLLAIDAFVAPLGVWRHAIWPTYAIGQILLATGLVVGRTVSASD